MGQKHHKPAEIVAKLWQVEVLTGQCRSVSGAVQAQRLGSRSVMPKRAPKPSGPFCALAAQ